jgi:hypothetical protein
MKRSTCCFVTFLVLGACAAPGRPVLMRDDGDRAAYPADFGACKARADRLYDPADPALAFGRYDTVVSCLMAKGYTYEPRTR